MYGNNLLFIKFENQFVLFCSQTEIQLLRDVTKSMATGDLASMANTLKNPALGLGLGPADRRTTRSVAQFYMQQLADMQEIPSTQQVANTEGLTFEADVEQILANTQEVAYAHGRLAMADLNHVYQGNTRSSFR